MMDELQPGTKLEFPGYELMIFSIMLRCDVTRRETRNDDKIAEVAILFLEKFLHLLVMNKRNAIVTLNIFIQLLHKSL